MFNEGNQIHNFMSSSGSGTVINYGSSSGSDFLTSYGSGYGSGSTSQKVTVPTVPVPVPQHCLRGKWFKHSYSSTNSLNIPVLLMNKMKKPFFFREHLFMQNKIKILDSLVTYCRESSSIELHVVAMCSATATISYPASLSELPNGCQGHPRFCPPPDRIQIMF